MSIVLPTAQGLVAFTPRPIDFGGWQSPEFGGPSSRLDRMGNRFAVDYETPKLDRQPDGRIWAAKLVQAIGQMVIAPFPQFNLEIGTPGSPVANGGGQQGTTLNVRAGAAGYGYRYGQFFSLVHAGTHYLHMVTADVTANGSGVAALPIEPPLRVVVADGDALLVADPVVEGILSGAEKGWSQDRARMKALTFTVTEAS